MRRSSTDELLLHPAGPKDLLEMLQDLISVYPFLTGEKIDRDITVLRPGVDRQVGLG